MKRDYLTIALLIVIGAIFGSFFTYQYYGKTALTANAESIVAGKGDVKTPVKVEKVETVEKVESNETDRDKPQFAALPNTKNLIGENHIVDAVKQLSPSVVYITTTMTPSKTSLFFENLTPEEPKGSGSGIIVSADGYILTNQHVIEGAKDIIVNIDKNNGGKETKKYKAKVIGADRMTDLAVIKIEANGLPAAKLGDSDKSVIGEWVIAVGNPYGYQHTVTVGVLSGKGRDFNVRGREYPNLLQTDAAINPGNSGGPLANLSGEVIGVNTMIHARAQGLGFAIPINKCREIMDQLINDGKVIRPWIGIQMMPMDEAKAEYLSMPLVEGVLIARVLKGSPADRAGLQRADVILKVGDTKVNSPEDLQKAVRTHKVGDSVVLTIWRNKRKITISLKVQEMPEAIMR